MDKDFALLQVGINAYSESPLQGCVNDCENLRTRFQMVGASPSWYSALYDEVATRTEILNGLKSLINRPESTLIFQYSGHGTRVRDRNGDESSGYDSAICPVDFYQNGVILDDELAAIYDTVPTDKRLVILFDSCYSGKSQRSITRRLRRAFGMSAQRFIPENLLPAFPVPFAEPSVKLPWPLPGQNAWMIGGKEMPPSDYQRVPVSGYKTRRKSFLENNERVVLISTSKETQTSADAYIRHPNEPDGEWQGAGTAALLWAWNECGRDASYLNVATAANWWLSNQGYSQVLRVEGRPENQSRSIFT